MGKHNFCFSVSRSYDPLAYSQTYRFNYLVGIKMFFRKTHLQMNVWPEQKQTFLHFN